MPKLKTTHTASEARSNLYTLIRSANAGVYHEIFLRELDEPVVLMSKSEHDSWLETLDIFTSPSELKAIRTAKKETRLLTQKELLTALQKQKQNATAL